jgi:hypothetical protein
VKGDKLSLRFVLLFAAVFALTRIVVHLSGSPYFDPDTYKYLAGADSLLAGKGLPRLFIDLPLNGAALHVVPGYSFLTYAVWSVGGISIQALAVVQSLISFAGFLAFAHLIARWIGRKTAVAVFVALCLSPSIAWLEHSLMPDSIAAPLLMIALWAAAWGSPSWPGVPRRAAAAFLAGAIIGFEVLMRTSSQAYFFLPLGLALCARSALGRTLVWTALYLAGAALPLAPWVLQNHEKHGVYAIAVSSGRNLYFNAAWSGTLDRASELAKYGIKQAPTPRSSYALADAALQRQLASGLSLRKADRKLGEAAWKAYEAKPWQQVARDRVAIVRDLFVASDEPGHEAMSPLGKAPEWYLANRNSSSEVRQMLEQRFQYRFSDAYTAAVAKRVAPDKHARKLFMEWIRLLSFDGRPLVVAFAFSAVLLFVRSPIRFPLAWTFIAPPLAFIAAFAFFGAPLYRYQAGLHPFMLTAVVAACGSIAHSAKRRLPAGWRMYRRLAGYGQKDLW